MNKQTRINIVRGQVTDYAVMEAKAHDLDKDELVTILREIADTL